jgi:general secretion pathway protein D
MESQGNNRIVETRRPHAALRTAAVPLAVALATVLAGCATGVQVARDAPPAIVDRVNPIASYQPGTHLYEAVPKDRLNTATRQVAAEGLKALDAGEYEKANRLFNLALKTDINNSYLHFLNGYAYHLRGLGGESKLYALAQQGYEQALHFDPSNVAARQYLGLLYLDRRDYDAARSTLMEATLYDHDDPELLYDLAAASYYARDPRTAWAALQGLSRIEGDQLQPRTLQALAVTAAAMGKDADARKYLARWQALDGANQGGDQALQYAERRVDAWRNGYASDFRAAYRPDTAGGDDDVDGHQEYPQPGSFPQAADSDFVPPVSNAYPASADTTTAPSADSAFPPSQPAAATDPYSGGAAGSGSFFDKNMVMLDVTIIGTEEDNTDTIGVNLLDGLRIQFGNSVGTPGYSRQTTTNSDLLNPIMDTSVKQVSKLIQVPALTYTLNIANAEDRRNEVLARPTLVATGGQTSTFFSGVDVIGAAVSTGQGGSVQVQKEAGVKLSLTPEFLPGGLIKMNVEAERNFLTNPNSNVLFDFRLDTSKTQVSANVVMRFGETLILSGLSERNVESNNSGVPLLRDVPIVQYLFSRKTKRDYQKSVLILVTPRRPSYTNRPKEEVAAERAAMSDFERTQAEFEDRFKQWYAPAPNWAQISRILETSPLYREFRTGDLRMESWVSRATHGGRLRSVLGFLFY